MAMNLNFAALSAVAQAGIRRSEVQGLPKGWIREETPRFAYGASGKPGYDVVYYTPKGHRIRTKHEMAKVRLAWLWNSMVQKSWVTGRIN